MKDKAKKIKLSVSDIQVNPNNPRLIKDTAFKKLVKSVKNFPEMLEARPIVVNLDNVILGGNMRFRAIQEAGLKEIEVLQVDWPQEKQDEFVAKDNASAGEWDWEILANEWDTNNLNDWGIDLPSYISATGTVDHFANREEDGDALDPKDTYDNRTSNTLILIYKDEDYKRIIEVLQENIKAGVGDTPSEVIFQRIVNERV